MPSRWEAPSPAGRSAWTEGLLQSLRGERSNWFLQKSEQHRRPVLPSLRHSSARAGGGWVLKLRLQRSDSGRGPGLGAQKQREEAGLWWLRVYPEEAWAHQRGKVPLFRLAPGEGHNHQKSFFPCVCAPRQQDTTYRRSRGGYKSPPP